MSDTTQRLCTNHDYQISFVFGVYFVWFFFIFLYTEGANSLGQVLVCCMHLT